MIKAKIFKLFFLFLPFAALAQVGEVKTKKLTTPVVELNGYKVTNVKNDTNNIANADNDIMTAKAIYQLVKMNTGVKGDKGDPGPTGATGATGPAGLTGATGAPGADGLRGTQIFSGGVPNPVNGLPGDYWISTPSGILYFKSGVSTWSSAGSLMGPKGDKGDPGTGVYIRGSLADSTLLPGSHASGDAYLISGNLWVSNGTAFNNVGHIQGPAGTPGATGATGAPGATGATGAAGLASKWITGAGAPAPGTGDTLSLYLNKSTGDVYKKNTGSWVLDVNIKGPTGATGATGANGIDGAPGTNGTNGKNGSRWYTGTVAPSIAVGDTSDMYLNTTNGDLYRKNNLSIWTYQTNITGPPGGGTVSVTGNEYKFTATASQTTFTSPYGLPAAPEKITVYRNGMSISFTKSSSTFTLPVACDAGDTIFAKWID